jgi:hypothetical protein
MLITKKMRGKNLHLRDNRNIALLKMQVKFLGLLHYSVAKSAELG